MVTHSGVLAWRIPGMGETGGLPSMGSQSWTQLKQLSSNSSSTILVVLVVKNPPASARDIRGVGSIPGSGRFPGGEHSNPLQHSCLENPMDRGAWRFKFIGPQRVRHSWSDLAYTQKKSF